MQLQLLPCVAPPRNPRVTQSPKRRQKRARPPVIPSGWRLPSAGCNEWLARFLAHFGGGRFLTLLRPLDAQRRLFPAIPATADDQAAMACAWPAELRLSGWPYPGNDVLFFDGAEWSDGFEPWAAPIGEQGPRQAPIMATAERVEITEK